MVVTERFMRENLVRPFPPIERLEKVAYLEELVREGLIKRRNLIQRMSLKGLIEEIPSVVSLKTRRAAMAIVTQAYEDVRMGRAFDSEAMKEITKSLVEEILINRHGAMVRLIKLKDFDEYTFTHSINVAILAPLIGIELRLSRDELEELTLAAMLHDIGKIRIDRQILMKPGPLVEEEFNVIKRHTVYGYQILSSDPKCGVAKIVAKQHHERQDGSGYPEGLKGDKINDLAAIISVCDAYDALTSDRPYRKKFLPYEAMTVIISASGPGFKREIVAAFLSVLSIYPQGSLVQLNTGEIAIVSRANRQAVIRPVVKLLIDADGQTFKEGVEIDLLTQPHRYIVGYVDEEVLSLEGIGA